MKRKPKVKKDEFVVIVKPYNDAGFTTYSVGTIVKKLEEREGFFLVESRNLPLPVWVPSHYFQSNIWPEM